MFVYEVYSIHAQIKISLRKINRFFFFLNEKNSYQLQNTRLRIFCNECATVNAWSGDHHDNRISFGDDTIGANDCSLGLAFTASSFTSELEMLWHNRDVVAMATVLL